MDQEADVADPGVVGPTLTGGGHGRRDVESHDRTARPDAGPEIERRRARAAPDIQHAGTDDGTEGIHGRVAEPFAEALEHPGPSVPDLGPTLPVVPFDAVSVIHRATSGSP